MAQKSKVGVIEAVVVGMPQLVMGDVPMARQVQESLQQKWDAEINGTDHQRVSGQAVAQRLAPGFEWMYALTDPVEQKRAEYLRCWLEAQALSIDKKNKRDIDERRLAKLKQRLGELESAAGLAEAVEVAPISAVGTLDIWN